MRRELDEKLTKSFPNLYRDRFSSILTSCLPWGYECNDGWYNILFEASEKLEKIIIQLKEDNPLEEHLPKAVQVKEKFGTLRIYLSNETEEMSEIVEEAERISAETCEQCGKLGKSNKYGWIETLCDGCRGFDLEEREKEFEELEKNKI